jgi:amidase
VISHEAEKEVIGMSVTMLSEDYLLTENDFSGPMTRTVEDCALLLEVIAGPDWIDLRQNDRPMPNPLPKYSKLLREAREKAQRENPDAPLKGVRIGVLKEGFTVPKGDERVSEVAKDAIEGFRKLGAEIREISCPSHVQLSAPNSVATVLSGTAPFVGRSVGSKHLRLGAFWSNILPWTPEKWEKVRRFLLI